jgi:hypothetical protein
MKAGSWFLSLFWRKNSFHSSKRKSVLSYYYRKRVNGKTEYFGRIYPDTSWQFDNKCPDFFYLNLCLEINFIFFFSKVREKWKPGRGFLAFFGEKILFIQVKEKVCFLNIFSNGWMARLNILGRIYPETSWQFDNKCPDYFHRNLCLEINFIFFCFEN